MAYSSIADLPSQVRMSFSKDDQEFWKDAYNSRNPQNEEEAKEARRFAWDRCRERPSSFSFSAYASVDDWDIQNERIDIDSLMKTMDRYIESGSPLSWNHSNYQIGSCWGYERIKKDGRDGVKIYGNLYGGDNGIYDEVRKRFMNGARGFSVAGESGRSRYECDENSCGRVLMPKEILEIALTPKPANPHAMTIDFHEPSDRFAKSADSSTIRFTEIEVHRDESTCPILSLRKSLRDSGIDAHARTDGVFIPMSSSDFAKSVGSMRKAGLCVEWTDGGALVKDKDVVLEQLFKEGFEKGCVDAEGVLDDSDYEFFSKACGMGLLERRNGEYRLVDPTIFCKGSLYDGIPKPDTIDGTYEVPEAPGWENSNMVFLTLDELSYEQIKWLKEKERMKNQAQVQTTTSTTDEENVPDKPPQHNYVDVAKEAKLGLRSGDFNPYEPTVEEILQSQNANDPAEDHEDDIPGVDKKKGQ